jgi:hypothetical protein
MYYGAQLAPGPNSILSGRDVKKWFEYQLKNQRQQDYLPGSSSNVVANIASQMQKDIDYVFSIYATPRVIQHTEKVFSKDFAYTDSMAPNVPTLDRETLDEWIYDSAFNDLLDRPSHEVVYFHESHDRDRLLKSFCNAMTIVEPVLKEGLGSVKLHVQHPGQIFALHFDRPQHQEFRNRPTDLADQPAHIRFLVFMQDQMPGQIFQMDDDFISWRQGDVFTWDARNTMHGSCNFGFWPRFMLMFTLALR